MKPRFHVLCTVMHFGNRDEFIGTSTRLVTTAFTQGWANWLANRDQCPEDVEVQYWVRDQRPPAEPPPPPLDPHDWSDDLPF